VVCGAHLLGLQIYTGSSGTGSAGRNGRQLFPRQTLTESESSTSQGSVLSVSGPLSSTFCKKKKKGRNSQGLFPRQTCPSGCAAPRFPWLLGAIKCCFKGQSLNFMCTYMLVVIKFAKKNQNYPNAAITSPSHFLK
jgi:hypothetical protein